MKTRIFIDTGIFMYARGKDHPLKVPCSRVILAIAEDGALAHYGSPAVNTEVFQEILYRYIMLEKGEVGAAICRDIFALEVSILPVTGDDMSRVLELFGKYESKGIPPRDLIHAAVMINNGIHHIVSADKHFDAIREVKRIQPEELI